MTEMPILEGEGTWGPIEFGELIGALEGVASGESPAEGAVDEETDKFFGE